MSAVEQDPQPAPPRVQRDRSGGLWVDGRPTGYRVGVPVRTLRASAEYARATLDKLGVLVEHAEHVGSFDDLPTTDLLDIRRRATS